MSTSCEDLSKFKWDTEFSSYKYSLNRSSTDPVRTEEFEGRTHYVFPVVAVKEKVLNGELLPAEEIAEFVQSWNGVPVTIDHPRDAYGLPVVANSPETLEAYSVGRLFNVYYEDKRLKGELWIDEEKVKKVGEDAIKALDLLRSGGPLEVSTGYFAESEFAMGSFNGDAFEGIQHNLRPDHLALLPNDIGACSWEDGCGAPRINSDQGGSKVKERLKELLVAIGKEVGLVVEEGTVKCQSCGNFHNDISYLKTDAYENSSVAEYYICPSDNVPVITNVTTDPLPAIYMNGKRLSNLIQKLVTDQATKSRSEDSIIRQLAKQANVDQDKVRSVLNGEVDFLPKKWVESFSEVLGVDSFEIMMASYEDLQEYMEEAISANSSTKENVEEENISTLEEVEEVSESSEEDLVATTENNSENRNVSDESTNFESESVKEESMTKCEKVNSLIENESTQFVEEDRDWLMGLEDIQLDKLSVVPESVVSAEPVKEEPKTQEAAPEKLTAEQYVNQIEDDEVRELLEEGLKQQRSEKKKMITEIVANSQFAEEELIGKSMAELKKVHSMIPDPDYSGAGGPKSFVMKDNREEQGVPEPPPVVLAREVN